MVATAVLGTTASPAAAHGTSKAKAVAYDCANRARPDPQLHELLGMTRAIRELTEGQALRSKDHWLEFRA